MSDLKPEQIAAIVRDAGGCIVGRTRLQKIAYLLSETGLDDGFRFRYKHYGPFSESVASSAKTGSLLGHMTEEKHQASWGGTYSIYRVEGSSSNDVSCARCDLAQQAAAADAIELELAATAVYLARDGFSDAWAETARRKPEKAIGDRLNNARALLSRLKQIEVPRPLPENI